MFIFRLVGTFSPFVHETTQVFDFFFIKMAESYGHRLHRGRERVMSESY